MYQTARVLVLLSLLESKLLPFRTKPLEKKKKISFSRFEEISTICKIICKGLTEIVAEEMIVFMLWN